MEIVTIGTAEAAAIHGFEKLPFITMLYIQDGEHKICKCDRAGDFIKEFGGKTEPDLEVAFFFIAGQPVDIRSVKKALGLF